MSDGNKSHLSTGGTSDHLLVLKVMRLTNPSMSMPLVLRTDPKCDILKDTLNNEFRKDPSCLQGLEEFCLGRTLMLPQSFGSIYLGETFKSYVNLHNDSTDTCNRVNLRCDLQTSTQRIPLYPLSDGNQPQQDLHDNFFPGSSIDKILSHEVKELGPHILVCDVTYSSPHKEKLSFRKYFKFQVLKPLDVKTKFYNAESDDVFLEAQVQNITNGPLCLEKVVLDPSHLFSVTPMNEIPDKDNQNETRSVFGRVNCLQSHDARQYLFCLTPKPEVKASNKLLKGVSNIGKLDIVWRTYLGDRGRLQTSQLQRMVSNHGDVRFSVERIPSAVLANQAFSLVAKIINNCDRTIELEVNLINVNQPQMIWSGFTSKKLGLIEPNGAVEIEIEAVPRDIGLQSVSGVRITDSLLKRTYEFDDVCQVFVCEDEELVKAVIS